MEIVSIMPLYTFKCEKCKKIKDILQGMNDTAPSCIKCLGKMVRLFKPNAKPGSKDGSWGFKKNRSK
jgi:putative FmdB family regulatory protein